jgi:HK97 family phage major capsid protein
VALTAPTMTGQFSGFLTPEQAAPFWETTQRSSVVQQLVTQRAIGINGQQMPVKLSKLTAGWVGEGQQKPASQGALGLTTWRAHKIAAITVVSAEVVRANPGGYMNDIRPEMGEAFGIAFDQAVFSGTASPFGTGQNLAAATKSVTLGTATAGTGGGYYSDLNEAVRLIVADRSDGVRRRATGWAVDTILEPDLNGALDAGGRPYFNPADYTGTAPVVTQGRLLGRPFRMADHVADDGADAATAPVGYLADWSQMVWGQIGGISYDVSTQATVTLDGQLVSLWENNLLAVRAETEFAFVMKPGVKADGTVGTPADPGGALGSVVKLLPEVVTP